MGVGKKGTGCWKQAGHLCLLLPVCVHPPQFNLFFLWVIAWQRSSLALHIECTVRVIASTLFSAVAHQHSEVDPAYAACC